MSIGNKRLIIVGEFVLILVLSVFSFLKSKKTNENVYEYEKSEEEIEESSEDLVVNNSLKVVTQTPTPDSGNIYYLDIIRTFTPTPISISTIVPTTKPTNTPALNPVVTSTPKSNVTSTPIQSVENEEYEGIKSIVIPTEFMFQGYDYDN